MFDLADVFELVVDRFNQGPLSQEDLVDEGKQLGLHVLAELGDEFDPLGSQGLEEFLGDVATVAEELSGESLRHRGDGAAVVGVARSGPDPQQVATVADDQVQLESEEPSHRGLPSPGDALKDLVGVDAGVVADPQRGRVNEAHSAHLAATGSQVVQQRPQDAGDKLDEAAVARRSGKLSGPVAAHVLRVVALEVAVPPGVVEHHQNRHDLAQAQARPAIAPG